MYQRYRPVKALVVGSEHTREVKHKRPHPGISGTAAGESRLRSVWVVACDVGLEFIEPCLYKITQAAENIRAGLHQMDERLPLRDDARRLANLVSEHFPILASLGLDLEKILIHDPVE